MSSRFQAGIIIANPTDPTSNMGTGAASGVWSLTGMLEFRQADTWPTAGNVVQRALIFGGNTGSVSNSVDTYLISSAGNATDFGDLIAARNMLAGAGSNTRAIVVGCESTNQIQYFTYASAGNGTDFGDTTTSQLYSHTCCSSATRTVIAGGYES